jgi:hypothetical protein
MDEVSTVGIDLAKSVFQLHGSDGRIRPARAEPSGRQFKIRHCNRFQDTSRSDIMVGISADHVRWRVRCEYWQR